MNFRRILDLLGRARSINEVNADDVRITALELALEKANKDRDWWEQRCRAKSVDLVGERIRLIKAESKLAEDQPLVAYALRQKANRARYDAKRRGK